MKKASARQGSLIAQPKESLPPIEPADVPSASKSQKEVRTQDAKPQDDGRPKHIPPKNAQDSLTALESIIKSTMRGKKRQYELLAPPPASGDASPFVRFEASPSTWPEGWCRGWAFCPPPSMADALDINLTLRTWKPEGAEESIDIQVWTQGSKFKISEGHVIYRNDCLGVYEGQWAEALMKLPEIHCLQVLEAVEVAPFTTVNKTEFPFLEPPSEERLKALKAEIEARGNIAQYKQGTKTVEVKEGSEIKEVKEKIWLLAERARREAGSVTFATLEKQNGRLVKTGRHTVTQDAFIRFLITGQAEWL